MTDFYIASNGNNSNAGTQSAPWANPDAAKGKSFSSGDRVLCRSGDQFQTTQQISIPAGVTWDRYGEASHPLPILITPTNVAINAGGAKLRYLHVKSNAYGVRVAGAPDAVVEFMKIEAPNGVGLEVGNNTPAGQSPRVIFRKNEVFNCRGTGINFFTQVDLLIEENTVYNACMDNSDVGGFTWDYTAGIKGWGKLGGRNCKVLRNIVHDCGFQGQVGKDKANGIWADFNDFGAILIAENEVYDNWNNGIKVEITNSQQVRANHVYHNSRHYVKSNVYDDVLKGAGIALFRGCYEAIVEENVSEDHPTGQVVIFGYPGNDGAVSQHAARNIVRNNTFRIRAQSAQGYYLVGGTVTYADNTYQNNTEEVMSGEPEPPDPEPEPPEPPSDELEGRVARLEQQMAGIAGAASASAATRRRVPRRT